MCLHEVLSKGEDFWQVAPINHKRKTREPISDLNFILGVESKIKLFILYKFIFIYWLNFRYILIVYILFQQLLLKLVQQFCYAFKWTITAAIERKMLRWFNPRKAVTPPIGDNFAKEEAEENVTDDPLAVIDIGQMNGRIYSVSRSIYF